MPVGVEDTELLEQQRRHYAPLQIGDEQRFVDRALREQPDDLAQHLRDSALTRCVASCRRRRAEGYAGPAHATPIMRETEGSADTDIQGSTMLAGDGARLDIVIMRDAAPKLAMAWTRAEFAASIRAV